MEWINQNAGILTILFSGVVAISTVVYAVLTATLVRETIRMREAETDPALAVFLTPSERWLDVFELVIQNHGRGTAFDISWQISPSVDQLKEKKIYLDRLKLLEGLSQLAPGQAIRTFFGQSSELLAEPVLPPLRIVANYRANSGERSEVSFVLDASQFSGITRLGQPPEDQMAKSLELIAHAINKVVHGPRLSIETITEQERREQDRERREAAVGAIKGT